MEYFCLSQCPNVPVSQPVPTVLCWWPAVVPVWVSSKADLQAVEAAATSQTGRRFQFGLYSLYYWRAARKPWELPLISFGQLLLWLQVSCAVHNHEQNILGWLGCR